MGKITKEQIEAFFAGSDPMEHIIKIECSYDDSKVHIIYRNDDGVKMIRREAFHPFVWAKQETARSLFGGDRKRLKKRMEEVGIEAIGLRVNREDGTIPERMENGYRVIFRAKTGMSYNTFLKFFEDAGVPIFGKNDSDGNNKPYIAVAPVEQFMIATGKRMFKGYDDYDELLRLEFDLETEGLDPKVCAISQIGVRTNRGYEKIISIVGSGEEKRKNEITAISQFLHIIKELKPDIITGHNTENFDWYFIDERLKLSGSNLYDFSKDLFPNGIYKKKKQAVLKLGGEMEYYYPTVMWGTNITDSLFAVRRAMAINSDIKSANLKYITKYSKLEKPNRVYVPGKIINKTWEDETLSYLFNDKNGAWFKMTPKVAEKTYVDEVDSVTKQKYTFDTDGKHDIDNQSGETYEFVSGRYIVQRYLLDDLWETDKVELQFNQTNYLVCKMIPVPYEKACTMGTAGIWKAIMLAWCYENRIAIPELRPKVNFTGGLSRLVRVGRIPKVVKLDYNSLYPSIIISFDLRTPIDVVDVMIEMLIYILTQRELHKDLKKKYGKEADQLSDELKSVVDKMKIDEINQQIQTAKRLKGSSDRKQAQVKVLANSYFGGAGADGKVFPFSDCITAEETTCTGRQCLRLMIGHFSNLGTKNGLNNEYNYIPVVGDSFTGDTPLFLRYKDTGLIDIKPISELIDGTYVEVDAIGREYDYSEKEYDVLCRSGWVTPKYIYRHRTDKSIYRVTDIDTSVDVTEDHSVFLKGQTKVKPSEIHEDSELEYSESDIKSNTTSIGVERVKKYVSLFNNGSLKRIPIELLNASITEKRLFLRSIGRYIAGTKTMTAGLQYLRYCIS